MCWSSVRPASYFLASIGSSRFTVGANILWHSLADNCFVLLFLEDKEEDNRLDVDVEEKEEDNRFDVDDVDIKEEDNWFYIVVDDDKGGYSLLPFLFLAVEVVTLSVVVIGVVVVVFAWLFVLCAFVWVSMDCTFDFNAVILLFYFSDVAWTTSFLILLKAIFVWNLSYDVRTASCLLSCWLSLLCIFLFFLHTLPSAGLFNCEMLFS